jgi:hypothetical protein
MSDSPILLILYNMSDNDLMHPNPIAFKNILRLDGTWEEWTNSTRQIRCSKPDGHWRIESDDRIVMDNKLSFGSHIVVALRSALVDYELLGDISPRTVYTNGENSPRDNSGKWGDW